MHRKGIALMTAVSLSAIAMVFTGVLLYLATSTAKVTGMQRRYMASLEAAKGVAYYLMKRMDDGTFCGSMVDCSKDNQTISLDSTYKNLGGFNVNATLIKRVQVSLGNQTFELYSVRITASQNETNEHSEVEFIYRVP
jgi:hypothetical protein